MWGSCKSASSLDALALGQELLNLIFQEEPEIHFLCWNLQVFVFFLRLASCITSLLIHVLFYHSLSREEACMLMEGVEHRQRATPTPIPQIGLRRQPPCSLKVQATELASPAWSCPPQGACLAVLHRDLQVFNVRNSLGDFEWYVSQMITSVN